MLLTATAIEGAIGIAKSILDRVLHPPQKREYKDLISDDLISIGLSVGYFNNFLLLLGNTMRFTGSLVIYTSDANGEPAKDLPPVEYKEDNIKVEIILPKRLDGEAFDACRKRIDDYQKGFFYSKANNRYYGINYGTMKKDRGETLIIVDQARPLQAAKSFYERILMIPTEANEKWAKTQVAEIAIFEKTLEVLLNRDAGILVNKLSYTYIG